MLHAIYMPQLASKSIYVRGSLLVSLTPIKIKSCGQPLRQYSPAKYEMYRLASDTRCRLGTESGDSRSICGKSPISGGCGSLRRDRSSPLQSAEPAARRAPDTRVGRRYTSTPLDSSLLPGRSCTPDKPPDRGGLVESSRGDCTTVRTLFTTESQRHRGRPGHNNNSWCLFEQEIPQRYFRSFSLCFVSLL